MPEDSLKIDWQLNKIQHFCQHVQHRLSFSVSVCPAGHGDRKQYFFWTSFFPTNKTETLIWFGLTFCNLYCQHYEVMSSCDVSVCPVGHRDEEEEKNSIDFCSQCLKKK